MTLCASCRYWTPEDRPSGAVLVCRFGLRAAGVARVCTHYTREPGAEG